MKGQFDKNYQNSDLVQEMVNKIVQSSPVVGKCTGRGEGCGNDILEIDIQMRAADENTCIGCTMMAAAEIVGSIGYE